ncbi:uncharacterized protein MEPE_06167 [Melanopsichium pennsylvanicum]|uniref:Uncharacterized protein n=2 Tax=Melanopsichium pennsylvanicum TaxID=63383 RepID=A0AAJ4XS84_9BASI|nr:hypothetical protein BN887_01900 [Melanopsichium pennsylvanicum 4]SNX87457.1 uncharacterized protein MEPE_06167 [Melanopsichium pennsylvanicum]
MSAELQHSQEASAVVSAGPAHLRSPPEATSSPIDGYATPPSPLALPPPDSRSRSLSSSFPSTLRLTFTRATSGERQASLLQASQPDRGGEEVDELDDSFETELPLHLDHEICERLEAESLLHSVSNPITTGHLAHDDFDFKSSTRGVNNVFTNPLGIPPKRLEHSVSTSAPANRGVDTVSGKRRGRPKSLNNTTEIIDLRFDSPELQSKKAKHDRMNANGKEIGGVVPFFNQVRVKDLLEEVKVTDVGGESTPEAETKQFKLHSTDTSQHRNAMNKDNVPAIATSVNIKDAIFNSTQQGERKGKFNAVLNCSRSSSDDDMLPALGSIVAPTSTIQDTLPPSLSESISKVEAAIADLKQAYEREIDMIKGKLVDTTETSRSSS